MHADQKAEMVERLKALARLFRWPRAGSRPAGRASSADLHPPAAGRWVPVHRAPWPRAHKGPAPTEKRGNTALPASLTVSASHWPPGLGGPARAPTHSHQRANEMVATQLLGPVRGGRAAQRHDQGRTQQHQRPGERAGVHSGGKRLSPAGTPAYRAQLGALEEGGGM